MGWIRRWRRRRSCLHLTDWLQRFHGDARNAYPRHYGWCRRCGKPIRYRDLPEGVLR